MPLHDQNDDPTYPLNMRTTASLIQEFRRSVKRDDLPPIDLLVELDSRGVIVEEISA